MSEDGAIVVCELSWRRAGRIGLRGLVWWWQLGRLRLRLRMGKHRLHILVMLILLLITDGEIIWIVRICDLRWSALHKLLLR